MIYCVTNKKLLEIIETREPKGSFFTLDKGVIVAVDNWSRNAWTEEFTNLETAIKWLKGEIEIGD